MYSWENHYKARNTRVQTGFPYAAPSMSVSAVRGEGAETRSRLLVKLITPNIRFIDESNNIQCVLNYVTGAAICYSGCKLEDDPPPLSLNPPP